MRLPYWRKKERNVRLGWMAAVGLLVGLTGPAEAQTYTTLKIGTLPGYQSSGAVGANDLGSVIGASQTGGGPQRGWYWRDRDGDGAFDQSELVDLGSLGNGSSVPRAINSLDQVVGVFGDGSAFTHGFIWKPGDTALTNLSSRLTGVFAGETWSIADATSITDGGTIGGMLLRTWTNTDGSLGWAYHPCLLHAVDGGLYAVQTLGEGKYSVQSLQENGVAVATWGPNPGYFWDGGTLHWVTTLGAVSATNSGGMIAGAHAFTGGARHAAYIPALGGQPVDLGTLGGYTSYANSVNDSGTIVGYSATNRAYGEAAFRWTPSGGMVNLNKVAGKGAGGTFLQAFHVTQQGRITGVMSTSSGNRGFVLIPK